MGVRISLSHNKDNLDGIHLVLKALGRCIMLPTQTSRMKSLKAAVVGIESGFSSVIRNYFVLQRT